MNYKIDIKRISDGNIHIQGWVLPDNPSSDVKFYVKDTNNNDIKFKLVRLRRDDVSEIYLDNYEGDRNFGFDIEFPYVENTTFKLLIKSENKTFTEKINKRIIDNFNTANRKKKELITSYLNLNTFKRAFKFLLQEGFKEFFKKSKRKLKGLSVDYDYSEWYTYVSSNNA